MTLQIGQVLQNRYRIVQLLGQGGFGAVYKALDLNMNHPCAVKENLDTSLEAHQQFQREAQILYTLRHTNLPAVIDYFLVPNLGQYLVMDYIEGQDLEQMRQRQGGQLDVGQVVNWVSQVCQALAYLHSQNPAIIHRDIKPANIKITPQGKAVLVDFGISKIYDPRLKTTAGARAITPGYSPIEQYGQGQTDARSDIYALGATLYTLLTGQEPAEATTLLSGTANLTPPRQLNPAIPGFVAVAIEQAMNSKPTNRYQAVADFQQALTRPQSVSQPRPTTIKLPPKKRSTQRATYWFIGIGLTGILCLLAIAMVLSAIQQEPQPTPTIPVLVLPANTPAIAGTPPPTDMILATVSISSLTPASLITLPPSSTDIPTIVQISSSTAIPATATTIPTETPIGVEVNMVHVPAGSFLMGSADGRGEEQPQHAVYLDAYWIGQTEVTNAMYAQCVAAGICPMPTDQSYYNNPDYANHPVVYVDWERANIYCAWTGGALPTEAQWEKAARGTDGRIYPWGNATPGCDLANYGNCVGGTMEVGSYPLWGSPYGALDMAGNVWEWVADWYDEDYYATSPSENPTGPSSGDRKVLRGGDWSSYDNGLRAAYRYSDDPTFRSASVGFRCAQE